MKAQLLALCLTLWVGSACASAQDSVPSTMLAAKTIIVLNETHTAAVEDGAEAALKQWGRLKLVETIDEADVVLKFDKQTTHSTTSTDSGDGKSYGAGMTFGSSIHMTATAKDGVAPFFKDESGAGKEKAGRECVMKLISSWQDAQRRAAAPPQ